MAPSSKPFPRPAWTRIVLLAALLAGCSWPVLAQEPTEADPDPWVGQEVPRAEARSEAAEPPSRNSGPEASADPAFTLQPLSPRADDRTVILLQRTCDSRYDREEVTLFANGTVRVRHEVDDDQLPDLGSAAAAPEMALGELPPDELAAWIDGIRAEDLSEESRHSAGPMGEMVERCRLLLDYDAMAQWLGPQPPAVGDRSDWRPAGRKVVEYGAFDSLGLTFARVLERVDGIAARVDLAAGRRTLPARYEPAVGDVLRRADGLLFRIERNTASPGGWELQGVDQPLALYLLEDQFPRLFTELVRRR